MKVSEHCIKLQRYLLVLVPLAAWPSGRLVAGQASKASREPASPASLTRAEMGGDLNHLTVRVKRAWAYAEDKRSWLGVDIDQLHATAVKELDQVRDADDFYFLVKRYVAGLMDGHAGVRAGHASPRLSRPYEWPFLVTRLDGRFYVKTLQADCGSLHPGDELLSVNGVPVKEKFETIFGRSTGSTAGGREHRTLDMIRGEANQQLELVVARAGGSNFTCELVAPKENSAGEEPISWKRLQADIGYVRLPSFLQDSKVYDAGGRTPQALQAALEGKKNALRRAFAELQDTRALILDLRGNGGGSDALGHFLAHCLCDAKAHPIYYSLLTRDSEDLNSVPDFAGRARDPAGQRPRRSEIQILPEKDVQSYPGRLAVLMDEGCFSACDCFLNYLAVAAPKTVFVGRPNGAGAGAPRPVVTLPNSKMVVTFCVMQVWNPDGQLIESRPLKPTVPVQWTVEDLRQGRDPDLEASLRSLEE